MSEGIGRWQGMEIMDGMEALNAPDSPRVLVFRSPLTDLGPLPAALRDAGLSYREVVMSMKSPAERARFQSLRETTGQGTLPQVFVDGRFVGGINGACRAVAGSGAHQQQRVAHLGRLLGYGGLLPFAAGAAASWVGGAFGFLAQQGLAVYGALILSFVGAVHWGYALARGEHARPVAGLMVAVLPALFAWPTLWLFPPGQALWGLTAGFLVLRAYERQRRDRFLPAWYPRLRDHLTLGAVLALAVGALAV